MNGEAEYKRIQQLKETISEAKRADSRNEKVIYNRKQAILRMQIQQLSSNPQIIIANRISGEGESDQDVFNNSIASLKRIISTGPYLQDEIWKGLIEFDSIFQKELKDWAFTMKQQVLADDQFLNGLYQITQDSFLSDECKLGALQLICEVTECFKRPSSFSAVIENEIFAVYLRIFRSTKSAPIFSSLLIDVNNILFTQALQGMAQLSLFNNKASDFFIASGLYSDVLDKFQEFLENSAENLQQAENMKDACILIHGLSISKLPFNYADPRLQLVFEYMVASDDIDIHYDVSTLLLNFIQSLNNHEDMAWVKEQLNKLYKYGLMTVVILLIQHEKVWLRVSGYNILTSISNMKEESIKNDFAKELTESNTFEFILESLQLPEIQLVQKYHTLLTLKKLISYDCIHHSKLNYLIETISQPKVSSNSQVRDCNLFQGSQKVIVDSIWDCLSKMKEKNLVLVVSENLISLLCKTLKDESEPETILKGIELLDHVLQISSSDKSYRRVQKWLTMHNFNSVINYLQSSKNNLIVQKAVSVASYLDSDEDSDGSEISEEDEEQEKDSFCPKRNQQVTDNNNEKDLSACQLKVVESSAEFTNDIISLETSDSKIVEEEES